MQPIYEKPRLCVSILTEGERCKTRLEKDDEEPLCKSRLCMRTISLYMVFLLQFSFRA
jgi:hypothetical protein